MFLDFERALQIDVQTPEAVRPAITDSLREDLRLESGRLQGRGRHKSRGVEPRVEGSRTGADLVRVSIVENIAPLQQRTGLPFVCHCSLPSAGNRGRNPRVRQPLSFPEWKLVNPGGGEPVRDAAVAQFPTGAGIEHVVIIVAIPLIYPGEVGIDSKTLR